VTIDLHHICALVFATPVTDFAASGARINVRDVDTRTSRTRTKAKTEGGVITPHRNIYHHKFSKGTGKGHDGVMRELGEFTLRRQ
jgi:hypothetical protein